MKRRIKQNTWGNWYGYEGTRRVIEFGNMPEASAGDQAQEWLEGKITPKQTIRSIYLNPADLPPVTDPKAVITRLIMIRYKHQERFPNDKVIVKVDANFGTMGADQDSQGYPQEFHGTELQYGSNSGWTFSSWPLAATGVK